MKKKHTITGEMIIFNEGGCHPDTVRVNVGDNPDDDYVLSRFTSLGELIHRAGLPMREGTTLNDFGKVRITIECID